MDKGVFRVNYYENNTPVSKLIVAESDVDAVAFVGAQNVSGVQAVRVMFPVEVAGLDAPHATVAPQPVNVAPFDLPKSVSRDEFNSLQNQLVALQAQLGGAGKPVSLEPTQGAVGTNPMKG